MRLLVPGLATLLSTAACGLFESTATGISVFLQAMPLVGVVGDTVTFTVNVTANNVSGVVINFGDSHSDQFATGGGATASVTFKHAYAAVGSFMSRATVSDKVVGSRVVTQLIVMTERPPDPPPGDSVLTHVTPR
jgi:hypothetical protein